MISWIQRAFLQSGCYCYVAEILFEFFFESEKHFVAGDVDHRLLSNAGNRVLCDLGTLVLDYVSNVTQDFSE
eukprot:m.36154 g.36154  ORF g.36154 m.36154 type:complete len:72 (-) comp9968_c0_seq2:998-1213(-)